MLWVLVMSAKNIDSLLICTPDLDQGDMNCYYLCKVKVLPLCHTSCLISCFCVFLSVLHL